MRYSYNKIGEIINGVILYFEEGDDDIAKDVLEIIGESEQAPTSMVWSEECLSLVEILGRIDTHGITGDEWVGIRFLLGEKELLRECLEFFRLNYPSLLSMVQEVESQLFTTKH